MSLYERVDRYTTPKSRDNLEYFAVYTACFSVLLLPIALRRLNPWSRRKASALSIIGEASAIAAHYATSSFMGI